MITLMEQPELKEAAASWFSSKWGIPKEAYLECMEAYLNKDTEYGWFVPCYRSYRFLWKILLEIFMYGARG